MIAILPFFIVLLTAGARERGINYEFLFESILLYIAAVLLGGIMLYAVRLLGGRVDEEKGVARFSSGALTIFSAIFIPVTVYTILFMSIAYPRISEQFGGGEPKTVQVVFKHDVVEPITRLGVPMMEGDISEPIEMLYESEQAYLLHLPNGPVIRLNKDLTIGMATKQP
jgi:hypothetical protein